MKEINKIEVAEEIVSATKKKQKYSVDYGLKALGNHIKKMEEEKVFTKDEIEILKETHKKGVERWIGLKFNI